MTDDFRNHLIWAFYVPSALIAVAYAVLTPTLPLYAGELTDAYAIIGIILAAESIGRLVGDVPSSWFIRKYGLKRTMLGSLWITLIPLVALFFTNSVWLTIVLLFTSGIGHALYNISRHAYIAVMIPNSIRGRAIGLLGGVFRFGKLAGPLLGGWVGGTFGLRYAFLAFVVLAFATMFFVWRYMETDDTEETPENEDTQHPSVLKVLLEHKAVFATAGVGQILAQLTRQGWIVVIPLYAANVLNLDVQTIGLIIGAGSLLDLLLFYMSGIIMDRFGRKWAIVPSFIMQGIGVALLPFASSAVMLAAISAFIGFANGLSSGTMMTLGADFSPVGMRGEFLSVWRLIGDLGFVGAPLLIGAVAQVVILQTSIFAVAGSGFGAAILFALFVPETLKRSKVKRNT